MTDTFILVLAYLLGSVPFGLLITKVAGAGDIRAIGSGNIGATNVLRTGKKSLAALTLLLDMLKGTLAVAIAQILAPDSATMAALVVLLGHMFPVWLRFKGGKGVATALGVMLALSWPTAVMAMLTWLAAAALLRISSASALIAMASLPVYLITFQESTLLPVTMIIIVMVYAKHYGNIIRLITGHEPRIGKHHHKS
ncbi:MAG: glycerol-3-phosphate 1-O-acyltransferase PlsY [Bdellovibrionales bacterium]|jgi:glycerol-3-phosphate acyltransferase PlsY